MAALGVRCSVLSDEKRRKRYLCPAVTVGSSSGRWLVTTASHLLAVIGRSKCLPRQEPVSNRPSSPPPLLSLLYPSLRSRSRPTPYRISLCTNHASIHLTSLPNATINFSGSSIT